MGVYFNPSNESFAKDRNYKIYIDKTGLLEYLNESLGTPKNCIAVSHARRFGKSHAAGMIDAYYSLGCDSTKLFEDTKIAKSSDFMTMLAGGRVMVETDAFQNDLFEIHSKDDALTALIHLGYLGYDAERKSAFIPNYEVATAFEAALQTGEWKEIAKAISICDEL